MDFISLSIIYLVSILVCAIYCIEEYSTILSEGECIVLSFFPVANTLLVVFFMIKTITKLAVHMTKDED